MTRITLVVLVVVGAFAISAVAVTADPTVLTESLPPMDQPGPRVGFSFTPMPKLVFIDGEEFVLRFTAAPLTGAVQVWDLDLSTYMTYGSRFEGGDSFGPSQRAILSTVLTNYGFVPDSSDPTGTLRAIWRGLSEAERSALLNDLKPLGFEYEPWVSALEMLQGFWTESGLCDGMLGLVSGPDGSSMMLHNPCLAPRPSIEALVDHGPTGWYEFTQALTSTLQIAIQYAEQGYPVEVFVANRGPVMDDDRDRIPEIIDLATAYGIRVNVIPMGNEPGSRMRFPYLKPLRELAEATGGSVYYQPNLQNVYDFTMLSRMVPQMMRDFYGRMGQIDRGTLVAPRASLVLKPSEHVRILSPTVSDVAGGNGIRIDFQNLTIGAPQSVDIRLRVSTDITGTLLPVFQGPTGWTDSRASYFEWIDPTGLPHRVPLPQRVISVTTSAGQEAIPTATATRRRVPSPTFSPSATATATPTSTPTATATRTREPSPTLSPSATATPTPTPTATVPHPSPTATQPAAPTQTATSPPSPTATQTATPLPTASSTATTLPSATVTTAPASPTTTATLLPTASSTPTATLEPTASSTPTVPPSATATVMPSATPSFTPTVTPTATPTPTVTPTATPTATTEPVTSPVVRSHS
ncbi:MAG: hypothetical protein ACE5HA_10580, partial [Anaerolineae bacterium]